MDAMRIVCSFALTKLDILDDQPVVKIAVAYRVSGQTIDYYPSKFPVCAICVTMWGIICNRFVFTGGTDIGPDGDILQSLKAMDTGTRILEELYWETSDISIIIQ